MTPRSCASGEKISFPKVTWQGPSTDTKNYPDVGVTSILCCCYAVTVNVMAWCYVRFCRERQMQATMREEKEGRTRGESDERRGKKEKG